MSQSRSLHFPRGHRAAVAGLVMFLALASAAPVQAEGLQLNLKYGRDDGDVESLGAGLRFSPVWQRDMGGNWKAAISPELEFNHFRHIGSGPGPGSLNELGGLGVLRLQRATGQLRPFAELGLGLALLSRDKLGGKDFSTHYQFTEQVGLGVEIGDRWFAAYRFSHYSNADIKKPNNGLDMSQILVGFRF